MKTKRRRISIIFWTAFCIYLIGLILPYTFTEIQNYSGNNPITERAYDNGVDKMFPLFCLLPISILIVLIYVKHTNFTRWTTSIISILMVFPFLPFLYFVVTFSLYSKTYPAIGFYVNCIAFILILIVAIIKFRIPAERNQQSTKVDVLDDF